MAIGPLTTGKTGRKLERFDIVLTVLLAGWVPSILMLLISYTTLKNTLESKILRDRQTFVQLVAHLVDDDLARAFAIVGTPEQCAAQVRALLDMGFKGLSCNLAPVNRSSNYLGLRETLEGAADADLVEVTQG